MASLNTLKRMTARSKMRVGRGGKRGKTSGKGTKGQNARSGRKKRPELRDIIKKIPKRRGYGKNRARTVVPKANIALSLSKLDKTFDAGAEISMKSLVASGIIRRSDDSIKIVGGETSKKFSVKGVSVTTSARSAIEKAGGSIA